MCNPFFQLITNSMMYGGGYMTGSGMETTAMLFSGVNSIFNCGCGYGGYGSYGYGNYGYGNSYNQNTMLGWAAGIIGFNVLGMLVNKGVQNHRENVATRQAQQAQNAKDVETALKLLGLTESEAINKGRNGIADLEIKEEYNDQALKNAKDTKISIETEIENCDTNIKDLDTKMKNIKTAYYSSTGGHAALVKQLNDLMSLPKENQDATKIKEIQEAIKQLEDNMAKCKPGGELYDSRKEFEDAKTQHESDLKDANTLIETITQKQQEFKEAKQTVINNFRYLTDKQAKEAREQKEIFNNSIDDVDGNKISRMRSKQFDINSLNNAIISNWDKYDWQKLLFTYRTDEKKRDDIKSFLEKNKDAIASSNSIDGDMKVLINSIVN